MENDTYVEIDMYMDEYPTVKTSDHLTVRHEDGEYDSFSNMDYDSEYASFY